MAESSSVNLKKAKPVSRCLFNHTSGVLPIINRETSLILFTQPDNVFLWMKLGIIRKMEEINQLKELVLQQQNKIQQLWAAIELAADDEAFFIHRENGEIVLAINLNDTVGYAVAYCKEVPWEEVPALLSLRDKKGWPALIRWAAEQEGWKPIPEIEQAMNEWDAKTAKIK